MKCYFCNAEIHKGTGIIISTKEGDIMPFCSSKCEKNSLKLKRKPQKVRWTGRYHAEKQIRLGGIEKEEVKKHVKETKKKTTKKERRAARQEKKKAVKAEKKKRKEAKASAQKPKEE